MLLVRYTKHFAISYKEITSRILRMDFRIFFKLKIDLFLHYLNNKFMLLLLVLFYEYNL